MYDLIFTCLYVPSIIISRRESGSDVKDNLQGRRGVVERRPASAAITLQFAPETRMRAQVNLEQWFT